jgi:predicted RNase H-like HicB family nuclease
MAMTRLFTMEYWPDNDWLVGRLREVPGVFSQGATLEELEENLRDAYRMMVEDEAGPPATGYQTRELEVDV